MPVLTVFAGPNGSGKSSLIRQVEFEGRENLLEPDAIARRIKPEFPQRAGIRPDGIFFEARSTFEPPRASLSKPRWRAIGRAIRFEQR